MPPLKPKRQLTLGSILSAVKERWFLFLSIFLFAFITLYPKVPLLELIPGYIVRVRLEDFFVVFSLGVYGIQLLRRKATLRSPLTAIFIFYAVVGVLVMLNAMFVVKTLPLNMLHIGKMFLHFARRLEYFSVFFLFYTALKRKGDVLLVFLAVTLVMLGVTAYGYGQKYLYWPVYSTMNREFSKGVRLVLTQNARVPSTFGGHYDMSAYTMVILTLLLAGMYLTKSKALKLLFGVTFVTGFWLLILGSSRSSFLAYILSAGVVTLFVGIYKKSIWWTLSRGAVVMGFSFFIMISFGDLSSRFSQLGIVKQMNQTFASILNPLAPKPSNTVAVEPLDKTDELPVPQTKTSLKVISQTVLAATPTPLPKGMKATPAPSIIPVNPNAPLPPDVYSNIPDRQTITTIVNGKTVVQVVEVQREFSPCTYKYGLSACIRFETLWPRAINGFRRNILLGSGFSTLTKSTKDEFTEAESTDNDFLRNLGESGILGVIGFYGGIIIFMYAALNAVFESTDPLFVALMFGMVAGALGLFFNALYIDVFEASKVAFMFWSLIGAGFAAIRVYTGKKKAL